MFAPRPQTHQISRHYNLHTTAKKNQNKENASALPTKTPSRAGVGKMLAPNTAAPMKMGLGGGPGAGGVGSKGAKGKGKEVDDIEPKRLFTNNAGGGMSSSRSFAGLGQSQTLSNRTKTPARTQVLRSPGLLPSLAARTPLPSASKPRRSSRRSSSISLTPALEQPQPPPQQVQQFATPAHKQKQWDEGESLGSISEGLNELAIGGPGPALDEVIEEEEDGEPEYMPPRAEPLPWEPVGAIPSVDEDMRTIMAFPPLWSMAVQSDEVPPIPELEPPGVLQLDLCDDDELEEPILRNLNKREIPAPPALKQPHAPTTQARTVNRPPTAASRMVKTPAPTSRARPGPPPSSSRITKPPVPRLGSRSATPATAKRPASSFRTTDVPPVPAPVPTFDMGLLGDTTPILPDDLDFGFDSNDDFDALRTP